MALPVLFSAPQGTPHLAQRLPEPLNWAADIVTVLERHNVECLQLCSTSGEPDPSGDLFIQKAGQQAYIDLYATSVSDAKAAVNGTATQALAHEVLHPCLDDLLVTVDRAEKVRTLMSDAKISRELAQQALLERYPWTPFVLRALFGDHRSAFRACGIEVVKQNGCPSLSVVLDHGANCELYLNADGSLAPDPEQIKVLVSPESEGNLDPEQNHWIYRRFAPALADCRETLAIAQEDHIVWRAAWALDAIHTLVKKGWDVQSLSLGKKEAGFHAVSANVAGVRIGNTPYSLRIKLHPFKDSRFFHIDVPGKPYWDVPMDLSALMQMHFLQARMRVMPARTYLQTFTNRETVYEKMPSMRPT